MSKKSLPPWFPLAAFVVGLFLVIIAVWTTVIIIANQHPLEPIDKTKAGITTPAPKPAKKH